MIRPLLAMLTATVALGAGLVAARVQCENYAQAGRLDRMARECAWLERCSALHRQRIAAAAFDTEQWIEAPARPAANESIDSAEKTGPTTVSLEVADA